MFNVLYVQLSVMYEVLCSYTEYGVRSSWLALSLKLGDVAPGS